MGRWRTQCEVIGWPTTQQEEGGEGHDTRRSGGGQHSERKEWMMQGNQAGEGHGKRKGAKDQMLWRMTTTRQERGMRKCEALNL